MILPPLYFAMGKVYSENLSSYMSGWLAKNCNVVSSGQRTCSDKVQICLKACVQILDPHLYVSFLAE